MPGSPVQQRTQAARTASTKRLLIEAAIGSLVDQGYARTTTVEICGRAGLTRGAYNHHYGSLGELYADALEHLYRGFLEDADGPASSIEDLLRRGFRHLEHPEFRAVIELWLACRNEPTLGETLGLAIDRFSTLFAPTANDGIERLLQDDAELVAFYRLAFEALIGLALGRATSRDARPVAHEQQVLDLLLSMARERDHHSRSATASIPGGSRTAALPRKES